MIVLLLITLLNQTILTSSSRKIEPIQLPLDTELLYNPNKPQISLNHARKPIQLHSMTGPDSLMTATCFNLTKINPNVYPKINYHLFNNVSENKNDEISNIEYLYIVLNFNNPEETFTSKKIVPLLLRYHARKTHQAFVVNKHIEHTSLSPIIINIIARHLHYLNPENVTSQPNRHALTQNPQQEADEELDQHRV